MKKTAIAGLVILLNIIAVAQIPSDTNLRIFISSLLETNIPGTVSNLHIVSGIVSNTQADVLYEFQFKQNRTNWVSLGFNNGSEISNWAPFSLWITPDLTKNTHLPITAKSIRLRSWQDSERSSGIPDWWKIKYFGDVFINEPKTPINDGWSLTEKFQKEMDPFKWYPPPKPQVNLAFREGADLEHENAILTWACESGTIPDVFTIKRANKIWLIDPNRLNRPRYTAVYSSDGKLITNRPVPPLRGVVNRPDLMITGAFQAIVRLPSVSNVRKYCYVDTNIFALPEPEYAISFHFAEPLPFAKLNEEATEKVIKKTILAVSATRQADGYELTVRHPIAHARYLLLVRDKNDQQWRASGYFVSGTNQNPVCLHADKKGMMTDTQSPIVLPTLKFLPDVIRPEFTAGWGEDSDGDGLPDIYEVLVTHTKPDDADTGDIGIPDGYRVFSDDGWNNWDKFRYRANPFKKCEPPPPVVLNNPTMSEMMNARTLKTDLPYESQIEIRTNAAASFQSYSLWLDSNFLNPDRSGHARGDLRVSWKVPPARP